MSLPLPDLDTRSFADLTVEAVATIPRRAPRWTNHNLSDPGITIVELLAAEVDRLSYVVNQITDRDRATLLRLLGFGPRPPQPARGAVAFTLGAVAAARALPAGTLLAANDPDGADIPLRLEADVRVGAARLAAVQVQDAATTIDRTRAVFDGEAIAALGDDPDPARGSALLLGLDPAPDPGANLHLWIDVGEGTDRGELVAEYGAGADVNHHDARVAWEWWDGIAWGAVAAAADETRALTQDGSVVLTLAQPAPLVAYGDVAVACAWIRCRAVSGRHDAAPMLHGVGLHAAAATQRAPAFSRLSVAAGVSPALGTAPVSGSVDGLALDLDATGTVTAIAAGDPNLPGVLVREYVAAAPGAEGRLVADFVVAGRGDRTPHQSIRLTGAPLAAATCAVWVCRGATGEPVTVVPSLDAAGAHDLVAVLDAAAAELTFGDGRRGRMLAPDELVLARYDRTAAAGGNLRPHAGGTLDADITLRLPFGAAGGEDAEDVRHAAGRASRRLFAHERLLELVSTDGPFTLDLADAAEVAAREAPERALNGLDVERVVLGAPGCVIARARAFAELDPANPGLRAAGMVTVVVVPELPAGRPSPTSGLLAALRSVIERRRIVGSRVVVTGPDYVVVAVHARMRAVPGAVATAVADRVHSALDAYLHPLTGGQNGRGWAFGRDVYRADVLAVLDEVEGVDAVLALDLIDPDGSTCGNVCVPPTSLVAPGPHELEIVS